MVDESYLTLLTLIKKGKEIGEETIKVVLTSLLDGAFFRKETKEPLTGINAGQEAKDDFTLIKADIVNIEDLMAELKADGTFGTLIKKGEEIGEQTIKAVLISLLEGSFFSKACKEAEISR